LEAQIFHQDIWRKFGELHNVLHIDPTLRHPIRDPGHANPSYWCLRCWICVCEDYWICFSSRWSMLWASPARSMSIVLFFSALQLFPSANT
jgi:hypothetical protein